MNDNNETWGAILKVALAWIGTIIGSITLSKVALFTTIILSCMQGYVLWRDKIRGDE